MIKKQVNEILILTQRNSILIADEAETVTEFEDEFL